MTPRFWTPDEARAHFLNLVRANSHYWANLENKTNQERCAGLAFSILNIFDGGTVEFPAIDLVLKPHPDDKEFLKSEGENWYVNNTVINGNALLHEEYEWDELRTKDGS